MMLPAPLPAVVDTYLTAADAALPGLIEGMYLVGSLALRDFRPHRSDIDFVSVTAARPDAAAIAALSRVHVQLQKWWPRPFFDGIYVTWDDLAADPTRLGPLPSTHEGQLRIDGHGDPVAWHTLAQDGVRCRGPAVDDFTVWNDARALAAWTNDNLDTYWRRVLDRGSRRLRPYGFLLTGWGCEWCVLGVSRIHYTVATGAITSKEGAGRYALARFPEQWHRVIAEALRVRRGRGHSLYRSPLARRRDVVKFCNIVIAGTHRVYREH
jgi:hypothetical protein